MKNNRQSSIKEILTIQLGFSPIDLKTNKIPLWSIQNRAFEEVYSLLNINR